MNLNSLIQKSAAGTPDYERSHKNLTGLLREAPEFLEAHKKETERIAQLFSFSQFLADYSIKNPACLSRALNDFINPIEKQKILKEASDRYTPFRNEERPSLYRQNAMKLLREIKKEYLLLITLRDISGISNLRECTTELSILSEALLELALDMSFTLMRRKYGLLRENAFTLIGMGKLGAEELNYSSDIDIISVYRADNGTSTGILNPFGIRHNKISPHEYSCMLTEILMNLLQSPTEDGIAYRVDLRLRPNGQKGPLSLAISSYHAYYEAWGKTWERIALIRARPVAGDGHLGDAFMLGIEPFVWKRSIDYADIDEIRELKKKIDTISDVNDIKRGYGGIRETEFFVHTFQLLYGGKKRNLRNAKLHRVLEELQKEGFLSGEDAGILSGSYIFLRRIEHVLQMRDDLQTYSLPLQPDEIEILAKKMDFQNGKDFSSELRLKRLKVRDMYNSLLGESDTRQEVMLSLRDELPEDAILDYLSFKGFHKPLAALKHLDTILDQISTGKTMRERNIFRKIVPAFLDLIVKYENKDRSLAVLVSFMQKIGVHESYTDLLLQRSDTRDILVRIFSSSSYLTQLILGLENLEGIFEYPDIRMDFQALEQRLISMLTQSGDPLVTLRELKVVEELKAGMLFLRGSLDPYGLSHMLSMLAETIIRAILHILQIHKDFAVIGLGGFGAEELNIGSDLDILFIAQKNSQRSLRGKRPAEEIIRFLSEYTEKGFAYKVDMRLRPDGSGGILSNDIEGYKNYYLKSAQPWEIQALLKVKSLAGDPDLLDAFQQLKNQVIIQRGTELTGSYIKNMRRRIILEVSKESSGYDLKNGPGGIKEIEFFTQYLQLKNAHAVPELMAGNTISAINSLTRYNILDRDTGNFLLQTHNFLRILDTFLRLNEEEVLKNNSDIIDIIMKILNITASDILMRQVEDARKKVVKITERYYT